MTDTTKSKPLHSRVIVQLLPKTSGDMPQTEGGLYLPQVESTSPSNPIRFATVLAVGDGEILYNGEIRPLTVEVGDMVRVHENEVLPFDEVVDYTQPFVGIIDERQILTIEN